MKIERALFLSLSHRHKPKIIISKEPISQWRRHFFIPNDTPANSNTTTTSSTTKKENKNKIGNKKLFFFRSVTFQFSVVGQKSAVYCFVFLCFVSIRSILFFVYSNAHVIPNCVIKFPFVFTIFVCKFSFIVCVSVLYFN